MIELRDNHPRFAPDRDHTESWFLRANDPHGPRALWIKATLLGRRGAGAVAEAWCCVFDGDRTVAMRATVPLHEATLRLRPDATELGVAETDWTLGRDHVCARGALRGEGPVGALWDLMLHRAPGALGRPLCLLPDRRLLDGGIPRNKLLTPMPVASVSGRLAWTHRDGTTGQWDIASWVGMQGHNWGTAHAPEYAWGHCAFLDQHGVPYAVLEGASGRLRLGPTTSPLLSLLTVRMGDAEYRFDGIVDRWNHSPRIAFPQWSLAMRGSGARAELSMVGEPTRMVCLGYDNPRHPRAYCLNSKTAAVTCRVVPELAPAFALESRSGGALEFLQPAPEPRVLPVV